MKVNLVLTGKTMAALALTVRRRGAGSGWNHVSRDRRRPSRQRRHHAGHHRRERSRYPGRTSALDHREAAGLPAH